MNWFPRNTSWIFQLARNSILRTWLMHNEDVQWLPQFRTNWMEIVLCHVMTSFHNEKSIKVVHFWIIVVRWWRLSVGDVVQRSELADMESGQQLAKGNAYWIKVDARALVSFGWVYWSDFDRFAAVWLRTRHWATNGLRREWYSHQHIK